MRHFTFLFFLFFIFEETLSISCPQKAKGISGLRSRLSNYLTVNQDGQALNTIEDQLWSNQTAEQIMDNFVQTISGVLTPDQMIDIVSRGSKCSSDSGLSLTELIDKVGAVLKNNILPFMNQITALISNLRTKKNMKELPVFVIVYRKFNQFILKENIETIVCNLVANFTQPQWTAIRNNLGPLFCMSLYPCTQQ